MVTPIVFCGQRLMVPGTGNAQLREYVCTVAEGHRSEFHMDVQAMATWSTAGDLVVHTDQRQAALRCDTPAGEHAMCAHEVNELRKQVTERGETIAKLRNALARTGPCCCPEHVYATIDGAADGDREMDPLCPRHGTVAELARQLAWAHSFTARIMAALPEEWSEPFHGGDAAAEIVRRMDEFASIDAVRTVLREAGLGYAPPADDVRDLAHQRDCAQERAESAEDALTRIADLARQALGTVGSGTPHPLITFQQAMGRIIAVTEEKDR